MKAFRTYVTHVDVANYCTPVLPKIFCLHFSLRNNALDTFQHVVSIEKILISQFRRKVYRVPLRCKVFARLNDCSNWDEVDVTFVQTQKLQSL